MGKLSDVVDRGETGLGKEEFLGEGGSFGGGVVDLCELDVGFESGEFDKDILNMMQLVSFNSGLSCGKQERGSKHSSTNIRTV